MIDFFQLDPIHTSNTPRGKILRSLTKKIPKTPQKTNPQLSFVVKSKNSFSNGKIFNNSLLEESLQFIKTTPIKDFAKTQRLNYHQRKYDQKTANTTLNLDKSSDFRIKSFSEALMRKKLKSVCYTRRQRTKIELNKCIQSLYLKVQSEKIPIQLSKIQKQQKQLRPYARSVRQSHIQL